MLLLITLRTEVIAIIVAILLAFIGFPGIINMVQDQNKVQEFKSQTDSSIRDGNALLASKDYMGAIGRYEGILKTISPKKYPEQWGSCQNSIGIAYYELALINNKEINLKKGIQAYQEALKIYTIESYSIDYAMTQNNLGLAYWALSEVRDKESNLEKAINAYREALKIYTIESYPINYATTQNNLEIALNKLGRTTEANAAFASQRG
jgi:tetratricopeptide (TPR) repeat protein